MKNLIALCGLAALLNSCSSTEYVHLSVQEPAPVTLPGSIKQVGIVDRTTVAQSTKYLDVADKVFSLSTNNLELEGAHSAVNGLSDQLIKSEHFTQVKSLGTQELTTLGAGVFPAPLEWDLVDRICKTNQVDALFVLEIFHTDTKVSYAANPANINTPLGNLPAVAHDASLNTTVKTGWRIYDPSSRNILDEFPLVRSVSNSSISINPAVAATAVASRKEEVKDLSTRIGRAYGSRITPYWLRVSRDYFVRGSDAFRVARRKAQTGNWNEAADLWMEETKNPSRTVAGRACYNMAIINEINGNLDDAISWAQRAYENYRIRLGLEYVNILKGRKANMALVKVQESE